MSKSRYVYFILLGWNNRDLLDGCLASIKQQTYKDIRIVYVDNGSKDGSLHYVQKTYPDVIAIDGKINNGFAIGNNIGIKKALQDADCEYIALLNTDATIDKNWTETLVRFAEKHSDLASMQTPTLDYYDDTTLDSRGIKIDPMGRAMQLGYREKVKKRYESHRVFGVNAAACIYTAEFLRTQPFDDDYFDSDLWIYLEDVDLAARAAILGYSNWCVEGAYAHHMGSVSSSKNPGFSIYHIYRNNALLLLKNLPLGFLLLALPLALLNDLSVLFSSLRGRNMLAVRKIIKGRLHSTRMFGLFLKKRRIQKKYRKISSASLWKLMNAR
jgi:GT2 family glycosyltransferase